jgi:hypothetical protein
MLSSPKFCAHCAWNAGKRQPAVLCIASEIGAKLLRDARQEKNITEKTCRGAACCAPVEGKKPIAR